MGIGRTNRLLRDASNFLAGLPGLPILIAVMLIVVNFAFQLLPAWPVIRWLARTDLWLHVGLIVGLVGILLGDAL